MINLHGMKIIDYIALATIFSAFILLFIITVQIWNSGESSKPTYPIHIVDNERVDVVERDSKWKEGDTLYLNRNGDGLTNHKPKGEFMKLGTIKSDSGYYPNN